MDIVIAQNVNLKNVRSNAPNLSLIVIYFFLQKGAAFDPNACGYSMIKDGKWEEGVYTRVHRDTSIINAMRSWMGIRKINNFKDLGLSERCFFNNYDQLSFLE